jgi:CubicO group peptidase (beta-lactamase class C family)
MSRRGSELRLSVAFAFLLLVHSFAVSQTPTQAARVGQFYAVKDGFSGNVVVFRDGHILSDQSYGLADVELNVPITATTRFAIGSVTKQFTAAAILLLQEKGLLHTTDKLSQHYPATPDAWKNITLQQLLRHTSGIPDGVMARGPAGFEQGQHSPQDVIESVASRPLLFPPGSRMQYDNIGYLLLGLVIERVSGQSYTDFLQTHFFTPLHMTDTGLGSTNAILLHRAYGYEPVGAALFTASPVPFTSAFAAGGLYSTGKDIAKWLIALHGGRVLKPDSYREMITPGLDDFAYGLRLTKQSGQTDISHDGRVSGFASETEYFPATKTGIVILSNKLAGDFTPGTTALDTDLTHLATSRNPAVRSLGTSHYVSADILSRYVGSYPVPGEPSILATLKDGRLIFTRDGKDPEMLIPQSETSFYMKDREIEIEFHQDGHGSWSMDVFTLPGESMVTLKKDPDKH